MLYTYRRLHGGNGTGDYTNGYEDHRHIFTDHIAEIYNKQYLNIWTLYNFA